MRPLWQNMAKFSPVHSEDKQQFVLTFVKKAKNNWVLSRKF
jgi:hypothetical protein